jgi:hypothetical protein
MNKQEIIDNAPEGATHINREVGFCKDGYYFDYRSQRWIPSLFIAGSRSLADIKRIEELEKERETQEQALKELLYCCDGLSTEYAERNYGDAEIWARHIHESYVKYQELQEQGE